MIVLLIILIALVVLNLAVVVSLFVRLYSRRAGAENKFGQIEKNLVRIEQVIKEEIANNRVELSLGERQTREETIRMVKSFEDSVLSRMREGEESQKNQLEKVREVVEKRLKTLQEENSQKLEQMRVIVDEKLHATLERRLGESFKIVGDRLESVYKGLGEMQTLASSVGDLKKVLTNVKTRGMWGEIQLGILLEEILTPEQYAVNVTTKKGSSERVEFAVKLPGHNKDEDTPVWLPIDAKFPQKDYQQLLEAQEQADSELVDKAAKQLEAQIKSEAKDIKEKYIDPPNTTDYGIMFLPTEGLYAEVLRRPGLSETLQRKYRVMVTGPMMLAALLNSLQMGFRTLAIGKRSSEVWRLLSTVKTEFGKFGDILDKTKKKLQEATNTIEDASSKTRGIQKKLRNVEELPFSKKESLTGKMLLEEQNDYNDSNLNNRVE